MAPSQSIILANSTALIHNASDYVVLTQTLILIKDRKTAKIAKKIKTKDRVEVIKLYR